MEEDLTLEEVWQFLREEVRPTNPPLSFSTDMFREAMGYNSRTTAIARLHELEKQGRVRQLDRYYIKDRLGRNQTIKGWQWNEKTPNS